MNKITMAALAGMATMTLGLGGAWAADGDSAEPVAAPQCDEDNPCWDEGDVCIYNSCYEPEECADAADCWTDFCGDDGFCAEPPSCSEDADCGEGTVCYGARCRPADMFCDADADCGEGQICEYGMCEARGDSCLSDAECGEFAHCVFDNYTTVETGSASANSTDPARSGGGSAGAGGDTDTDGAPIPDEDYEYEDPTYPYVERGRCQIDIETLPESADCRAMCEAAAACAEVGGAEPPRANSTEPAEPQSGSASSDSGATDAAPACGGAYPGGPDGEPDTGCMEPDGDDPDDETETSYQEEMIATFIAQCTAMCSYGVATQPEYTDDVAAAGACLANQDSCEAIEGACEDEIDAIGSMFDIVDDRVEVEIGYQNDSTATGDPKTSGEEDGGNSQALTGSPAPDNSSCNGSGGGAPLGLALLAALMLMVVRRRTA